LFGIGIKCYLFGTICLFVCMYLYVVWIGGGLAYIELVLRHPLTLLFL